MYVPTLGDIFPVGLEPFTMDNFVPQGGGIEGAVRHLHHHRSGGALKMK